MNSFTDAKMNIIARSITLIGLLGILLWGLVEYHNQETGSGSRWIGFAWMAIVLFSHFVLGLVAKEVAFGTFVAKKSESEVGYIICVILMGFFSLGFAFLAYAL